ncbi:hypothetical protein BD779DRAFT_276454 [Infundibulicybe gibba]|nr:hypothetical protein BD779DRAFT_276454 [Infundibulicybe gibba]
MLMSSTRQTSLFLSPPRPALLLHSQPDGPNRLLCRSSKSHLFNPPPSSTNYFLSSSTNTGRPVLIVEVKDDVWADKVRLHFHPDAQMHEQDSFLFAKCPLPCSWRVNFLGASLRVYCGDPNTRTLGPAFERHPNDGHPPPRDFLKGSGTLIFFLEKGSIK